MSSYKLSNEQVEHFHKEGYVVLESLFTAKDLSSVEEAIHELTEQALASLEEKSQILELEPDLVNGERVPRRIYNPYDQHSAFEILGKSPRLLDGIESLIGPNINLHHSKLNMKPARIGSTVEWHQDQAYFPHTNDSLVTTTTVL